MIPEVVDIPEKERPGKFQREARILFSLWDIMAKFSAENCCDLFMVIGQRSQIASTTERGKEIAQQWVSNTIVTVLMPATFLANELDLVESIDLIKRMTKDWQSKVTAEEYQWGLYHLGRLMESEMRKRLCFSIPESLAKYVDNKAPFGSTVFDAFPSARKDLTDAGNALGYGLNTAAAFHLMRAAEVGLWELGRDRQIPLAMRGKIEFTEWGEIIKELEVAVKTIQQWPNSRSKEEAHKFYNYAVESIRAFNDGWRRHAGHARPSMPAMEDSEALTLWGYVSMFLTTLAGQISEGTYTALVWP